LRLPMAIGRMERSTVLLSTSTRPSRRNSVNHWHGAARAHGAAAPFRGKRKRVKRK
jgi:hypothetical protein